MFINQLQMKIVFQIVLITLLISSCSSHKAQFDDKNFNSVTIDTLLSENISSRAIIIDENKVWYAGNNGKYGFIDLKNKSDKYTNVIKKDNLILEFRSIAQTKDAVFILTVANPALLYRIDKKSLETKLVYQENHEKVFYDSMQFLNENEGFAIGDPTENCPSFIKTINAGKNWIKISCSNLPKFADGEAFFATSNTNLIVNKTRMWMVSGGKKSRVFASDDKGENWNSFETPIIQGQTMTGAFCADFYNSTIGIIAGGNYEKLDQNFQNKAITKDGGKTWKLVSENQAFGYASCVQYIPNSKGKSIVSVGSTGLFYSNDFGVSWKQLSKDSDFLTIRFIDKKTAIATGKNRIISLKFN